jgi:DNA polymerase III delta subunit
MKQRPETLFTAQIPSGCLLYGNAPAIEDYLVLDLLPERLNASGSAIKTFTESELLATSKEKLYLESSLFESPKLYVVRDVTDKFLSLLQSYEPFVPLVMVGKNLRSSSKVVTHMNTHPAYQAIGIYGDDQQFLSAYARYTLKDRQLEPGVVETVLNYLTTFSSVRQQINLLLQLYPAGTSVAVDEVEKALIPNQPIEIFKIAEAVVSKNPKAMIGTFQKAQAIFEKESIPLVRIIAKQLWDLVSLKMKMDQGVSAQTAVNQATPMIPYNRRPQLIHNLSKWSVGGLLKAIVRLDELEILVKQPHLWSADQMERAFLQMVKL